MTSHTFTKRYATAAARTKAERNHAWLTVHAAPLILPRILESRLTELEFERIVGRHAAPKDLVLLAAHLGDEHGAAWCSALRKTRLTAPHAITDGHVIPGFLGPRAAALRRRLRDGHIATTQDLDHALGLLHHALTRPTAFYKDANPRNFLITPTERLVTLDPDDLTLAPFGYDLAKLVVTLSMTYGHQPEAVIAQALDTYNSAAAAHHPDLGVTTMPELLEYAELHAILTAPYLGRGGYRWPWNPPEPRR